MKTIPSEHVLRLPDGSVLTTLSDDALIRRLPLPIDFDAIEREAAEMYLSRSSTAPTSLWDLRDSTSPTVILYFAGRSNPADNGWQVSIASRSNSLAARAVNEIFKQFSKRGKT